MNRTLVSSLRRVDLLLWVGVFSISCVPSVGSALHGAIATTPTAPHASAKVTPVSTAEAKPKEPLVGYVQFGSWDRPGCEFAPTATALEQLATVVLAFAELAPGGSRQHPAPHLVFPGEVAGSSTARHLDELFRLRRGGTRVLLAVGGGPARDPASAWSWSALTQDERARVEFARDTAKRVLARGFDGVELSWPSLADPALGGGPGAAAGLVAVVSELRKALAAERPSGPAPLLTVAVPSITSERKLVPAGELRPLVDWLAVVGYGFAGDAVATADAPLDGPTDSVRAAVEHYASATGREKLVLVMPAVTRIWAGVDANKAGSAARKAPPAGSCTRTPGFLSASETAALLPNGQFSDPGRGLWASRPTLTEAAAWGALSADLSGLAVWSLDLDDESGGFPLLRAAAAGRRAHRSR